MEISHRKKKTLPTCNCIVNQMSLKNATSWTAKDVPIQGTALPAHTEEQPHLPICLAMTIPGASCFCFAHSASLVEFWFIPSDQTQLCTWSFYFFMEVWQHVRKRVTFSDLQNIFWWAQTTERSAVLPPSCLLQNPLLSLPVSLSLLSIASPTWFLQSSFACCRHHKTEVTPRYFFSICLLLFSMTPQWLVAMEATHSVEWSSIYCTYVP